jgi:hypothetical protein
MVLGVKMNAEVGRKLQDKSIEGSGRGSNGSFNFELWAADVRPKLIAALQKRSGDLSV